MGAKHGYAILNRNTGRHEYLKRLWNEKDEPGKEERFVYYSNYVPDGQRLLTAEDCRMRFNDGAVDSEGRYW